MINFKKRFVYQFVLLLFYSNIVLSGERVVFGQIGIRGTDSIQDVVWNKWETDNFIILSLDSQQGKQLALHIESIKSFLLTRWGLNDINFIRKCKVLYVPNNASLKKYFLLMQSYAEYRSDGSVMWLIHGEPLLGVLLTEICLREYEKTYSVRFGYWAHRGMSILSGDPIKASAFLSPVLNSSQVFPSKSLFTLDKPTVLSSSNSAVSTYDRQSALLVLMLRREFGQRRFLMMINDSSIAGLNRATGYVDYDAFDVAFRRYVFYATTDLTRGNMPISYFNITRAFNGNR